MIIFIIFLYNLHDVLVGVRDFLLFIPFMKRKQKKSWIPKSIKNIFNRT